MVISDMLTITSLTLEISYLMCSVARFYALSNSSILMIPHSHRDATENFNYFLCESQLWT